MFKTTPSKLRNAAKVEVTSYVNRNALYQDAPNNIKAILTNLITDFEGHTVRGMEQIERQKTHDAAREFVLYTRLYHGKRYWQ